MFRERYYRTVCCECCEDKKREESMIVDFDPEKSETILHLNATEMAEILFALQLAEMTAANPEQRRNSKKTHDQIRKGM